MRPDYLFVVPGAAAVCAGILLALSSLRPARRRNWLPGLLWACFGAGLLLQGFLPGLKIERNRWVAPPEIANRPGFNPIELAERQRKMQLLSGLLTAGAALGLLMCYRRAFTRAGRPTTPLPPEA